MPDPALPIMLALDPSSTCTGYAVLRGRHVIDAGLLRPKRIKGSSDPTTRILLMRQELHGLLQEHEPPNVIVEVPLEKQYTRQKQKSSGLAVWALGAGAIWMSCVEWASYRYGRSQVHCVSNTEWTRGTSKGGRQAQVAQKLGTAYDPARDPGADVSDAISMAWWYYDRFKDRLYCCEAAAEAAGPVTRSAVQTASLDATGCPEGRTGDGSGQRT